MAISLVANGATYYVATTGNDANSGTQSQPWRTINRSVNASSPAGPGDTILIQPGSYTELVDIQKNGSPSARLTIKGNGSLGSVRVIDPVRNRGWQSGTIELHSKHDINIEGLRVEMSGWGGITIMRSTNITVQNCYTYSTGASGVIAVWDGVQAEGEGEVTNYNIKVLGCTIEGANTAIEQESISMWGVDGFEVAFNKVFDGHTEGIDAKVGSRNGTIHDNEVTNVGRTTAWWGFSAPCIYIDANRANSFNIKVYNNYVHDSLGDGFNCRSEGIGTATDIHFYNNVCARIGKAGKSAVGFMIGDKSIRTYMYNNTDIDNAIDFLASGTNVDCKIVNNIAAGNGGWRPIQIDGGTNLLIERNLVKDQTPNANIFVEAGTNIMVRNNIFSPSIGFVNEWQLAAGSPAIDMAYSSLVPSTDLRGRSRPTGGGYDIGADEFGAGGSISREVWTGVSGTSVASVPTGSTPNITDTLPSLEAPTNWADNYGARLRGYITAPQTGNYTFWIAGDDNCRLSLSTDANPANKRQIAAVSGWTNSREWTRESTQKSAAIALTSGQKYYVEVLHKEGGGGDNLAVGWAKPGQSTTTPSEIVPGSVLSPFGGAGIINGGVYELEPTCALGKRLEVINASTADGANVHIWTDFSLGNQRWRVELQADGRYELAPQHASNKRLDVNGSGSADGTNVHSWTDNDSAAQRWRFLLQ